MTAGPSHIVGVRNRTPVQRLEAKVEVAENGCWNWTGATSHSGYGKINLSGRYVGAHRAAYELLIGAIPAGLELDHLCSNPTCVNPEHLEPVTHAENVRRTIARGRGRPPATYSRLTHCKRGHPFTTENTRLKANGDRCCRECGRQNSRDRRWRSK
jgi:hypothetical protein